MHKTTIKDIAKKLGVSTSSVSRAFNDKHDIKKETRDLILRTAKEMNYSPNPMAKKLAQNKSFNVGVVVPEFITEYYSRVIMAIQEVLYFNGYQMLVMQSNENSELELNNVKTLLDNMVDGLIISPNEDGDNQDFYLEKFEKGCPMVFISRVKESLPVPKVKFNNFKWSLFATEHLIEQGHKKIYHLSGHRNISVTKERTNGFLRAMEKHSIEETNYKVIETGLSTDEGKKIIAKLIKNNDLPDAFFCENDEVAMGAIKQLRDNKFSVPEDVAIMGFTETRLAELMLPELSSVKQPTFEIGRSAAEMLLNQIKNGVRDPNTIILDGTLNVRESSLKI